jgi:hypothetical protein
MSELTRHFATAGTSGSDARMQALSQIYRLVEAQASVLSYVDVIWIFVLASFLGIGVVFFAKRNQPGQVAAGH